jgi:hypothetical protein
MQRVKAVCGESRTYGLGRGKGCEALPIATGREEERDTMTLTRREQS